MPHPRSTVRRVVVVLAAMACLSLATSAHARPQDEAIKLADQAFDLMEKGEFDKAADLFEEAAKLYYSPVIALYWARAEAKQGRLVEARRIVDKIESQPVPDDAKPSWSKAIEDASIFGVELDGRIPTVTVRVVGATSASIQLDDVAAELNTPIRVDPGEHRVVVKAGDGTEKSEALRVSEKENRTVSISFDGDTVDAPTTSPSLVGPVIAYSVAGVALVIGTVTGIIFAGKAGELEDTCPNDVCPPEQADLLDETTTLGNVSTVAWVVAGVAAAAGTVLLFVPLGEGQEPAITVRATPVSASIQLRF